LRKSKWSRYAAELIPEDATYASIKGAMQAGGDGPNPYSRVGDAFLAYGTLLQTKVLPEADFRARKVVAKDTARGFIEFLEFRTLKEYILVMKGFVIALLRSACDAPGSNDLISTVRAPDYMKEDLLALRTQLADLRPGPLPDDFDCLVLHRVMLRIWTPPLGPKMVVRRCKDCLFVQFMILHSIRPCGAGGRPAYSWMDVHEVTRMLSALKFWCRASIEMQICRALWCPGASDMDVVEVEQLVEYLDESVYTRDNPFGYVCMTQNLACSIAGDTKGKPYIMSSDPSSCNIDGYDIHICRIRSMIQALLRDCSTVMRHEVLVGLNTQWIEELLERRTPILDAVNSNAHGYSFISDTKNPFLRHRNDLLRHMFDRSSSHYVSGYDDRGGIRHFDLAALGSWMGACTRLEDLLDMLLHLTASQPPRGKEYESFLVRNTATGNRALFWSEDTVVMYQDYSKTERGPKARAKLVARFLPHCLRRIFLEYLALVRPVQEVVATVLWDAEVAALYQDVWFVREGRAGDPTRRSRVMKREFTNHCGAPIGLKRYRHMAAFFSAPLRAEVVALQNKEPWAASAGHSLQVEGDVYAQNLCDHRGIGTHRWREFKFVALKWQRHLHLVERESDLPPPTPPRIPGSATYDVPAASSTPASDAPHPDIQFLPPPSKRRRLFHDCEGGLRAVHPLELIDPDAMEWANAALRDSAHSAWKIPEQGMATAMALDNRRDFIAILPTGSGKSFVYMAPARATGRTVVVVVPLLMLIGDHVADCRAAGISCDEFRQNRIDPAHAPQLVFVPVEIAIKDDFQIWAKQLISRRALHALVVDEVHLVLAAYRTKMTQLFLLSSLQCQIIGLTASLAPEEEVPVKSVLGRDFVFLRSKTTRPNLRYGVHDVEDIDADIADRLKRWQAADPAPAHRALVYCMTRREVEALHAYLEERGVPNTFLHARLETTEDKVQRLRSWEEGALRVMITTSVLGCGYNYPAVRLVIHRGSCFTLAGFHQESGRGGRDGEKTVCAIVSSPAYRRSVESRLSNDAVEDRGELSRLKQTNRWIEDNDVCRRFNLHRLLDGRAEVCAFSPGALACDVCLARQRTFTPAAGRSDQGAPQGGDTCLLEDLALPEACIARPACTRREMHRLKDLEDLTLVRQLAGDGALCLLCNENHGIHQCSKQRGRCLRCWETAHLVGHCPIKLSMQSHALHQCCHRCYFQLDAVGDRPVHRWNTDAPGPCQDLSGERIRILIWSVYRTGGYRMVDLKRLFPEMPFTDTGLEPWLVAKEPDHALNTFVRVAAAILRMQFL
jgi:superfamily II DNA or RNA helicase